MRPIDEPMLPFVMLPRTVQESNLIGKGGTAGFLGKAFDPYTLYPSGDDMSMDNMDRIRTDDLSLRDEVFDVRLQRGANPRQLLSEEDEVLRDAYGRNTFGQSGLLAQPRASQSKAMQ